MNLHFNNTGNKKLGGGVTMGMNTEPIFMDQYSALNAPGVVDQHGSNIMPQYSALNAPGVVDQH